MGGWGEREVEKKQTTKNAPLKHDERKEQWAQVAPSAARLRPAYDSMPLLFFNLIYTIVFSFRATKHFLVTFQQFLPFHCVAIAAKTPLPRRLQASAVPSKINTR